MTTIPESAGQNANSNVIYFININCSKVGTVFVYLLSNFINMNDERLKTCFCYIKR
jgi:hypothetical protein